MGREVTPSDLTITPRDRRFGRGAQDRALVAGRQSLWQRALRRALDHLPQGRGLLRRERPRLPRRRPAQARRGDPRLHHPGGDAQPRACRLQQARGRGRLRHRAARGAGRRAARGDQGPAADRQPRRDHGARAFHRGHRQPAARQSAPSRRTPIPQSAALWRWHSIEEIEHKGVAYDTWLHATRDWPRWKRWMVKSRVMLKVTRNFFVERTHGALILLAQDGIRGPRAWAGLFWYAMVSPGMFRKILGAWLSFFLPGFHPWKHDDRKLIAEGGAQPRQASRRAVRCLPGHCSGRSSFAYAAIARRGDLRLAGPAPARTAGRAPPRRGRRCSGGRSCRSAGSRASRAPGPEAGLSRKWPASSRFRRRPWRAVASTARPASVA